MKKPKKVLTRGNGTMTEAQRLAWIRSALRSKSLRWPPRNEALRLARRAYSGEKARQKWEYICAICKLWYTAKDVCVDHYPKAAGSILSVEDIGPFADNLFCEINNLRVLCNVCHSIHTLAEDKGIPFEKARQEKQINDKMKSDNLLAFLASKGFTGKSVSNEEKRRALVKQILEEENQHGQ